MAELLLLRRDLDHQALAKISGSHACGVKMLHQVNGAPHQVQNRRRVRSRTNVRSRRRALAATKLL